MRRAMVLLTLVVLGGCALPPAIVAGLGLSTGVGLGVIIPDAMAINKDADIALAADAGLKRELCTLRPPKSPGEVAWCANIPTDTGGLVKQWTAVIEAGGL